jgi:hypothetical protein
VPMATAIDDEVDATRSAAAASAESDGTEPTDGRDERTCIDDDDEDDRDGEADGDDEEADSEWRECEAAASAVEDDDDDAKDGGGRITPMVPTSAASPQPRPCSSYSS